MIFAFKIAIYIVLSVMTFFLVGGKIRFSFVRNKTRDKGLPTSDYLVKPSIIGVAFISFLWGIYSIYCGKVPYSSDRQNYAFQFLHEYYRSSSRGLLFIRNILRIFTQNPDYLFFTVTFLCVLVYLIDYRVDEKQDSESLKLFLFSYCIIYSFYLLKQAPAIALGTLAITLALKKKYIPSLIFIALSVLFHESAIILIPIFAIIVGGKRKIVRVISYVSMAIVLLAFSVVSRYTLGILPGLIPDIAMEATSYIDATGAIAREGFLVTVLKGAPYYLITLWGIKKRKLLLNEISHYDSFLVIGVLCSICWILSSYMYWLFRFAVYCYVPLFTFFGQIAKRDPGKETRYVKNLISLILIFFTYRYLIQMFYLYGGF